LLFAVDIPVTAADKYILANIDAKGVYRVWYEDDIFKELVTKLKGTSFAVRALHQQQYKEVNDAHFLCLKHNMLIYFFCHFQGYLTSEQSATGR